MGMPLKEPSEIVIGENAEREGVDVERIAAERQSVGECLAAVRKARGLSFQDVFNGTKIKIANLAAIETGDRAALPAVPFAAGFVKAYAQFLGLNPEDYAAAYRAECGTPPANGAILTAIPDAQAAHEPIRPIAAPPRRLAPVVEPGPAAPRAARSMSPENYVSYFGMGATVLCALWIGARVVSPKGESATPVSRVETPAATPAPLMAATPAAAPSLKPASITKAEAPAAPMAAEATEEASGAPATQEVVKAPAMAPSEAPPAKVETATAAPAAPRKEEAPRAKLADSKKVEALAAALNPAPPQEAPASAPIVETAIAPPTENIVAPAPAEPSVVEQSIVEQPETPAPAPTITAPAPSHSPGKIVEARLTRNAEPRYPERCARSAVGVETVEVAFAISKEGAPTGAYVAQSSNECFNPAALNAAYRLRFSPKTVDGAPSIHEGKRVTFRFAR